MNPEIQLVQTAWAPGDLIRGSVSWNVEKAPRGAEIRLFWYTLGKGDQDSETVEAVTFDHPRASDRREFQLAAPAFPPSLSGRLVSVIWAIECVVEPGSSTQIDLVIGPGAREIGFDHDEWLEVTDVPAAGKFSFGR